MLRKPRKPFQIQIFQDKETKNIDQIDIKLNKELLRQKSASSISRKSYLREISVFIEALNFSVGLEVG